MVDELPGRWPRTLLIDSKNFRNFRIRTGEHAGRGFHVLAAMGSEAAAPGKWAPVPRLWRLEPFARKDEDAWAAFFGALDGAPEVIVSDADHALACAIERVFGSAVPEHRLCEWHLGRKLREHLPDPTLAERDHPVTRALGESGHAQQERLGPSRYIASGQRRCCRAALARGQDRFPVRPPARLRLHPRAGPDIVGETSPNPRASSSPTGSTSSASWCAPASRGRAWSTTSVARRVAAPPRPSATLDARDGVPVGPFGSTT